MATKTKSKNVLPGFGLTLGFTLAYLGIVVLIPISKIGRASCRERVSNCV